MVDAGTPLAAAVAVSAAAGAVSFASPCVLPLVPGYVGLAAGLAGTSSRRTVLAGSALFVLGFASLFAVLGGAFGAVGAALAAQRQLVGALGGVLVLALGLVMLGVLRPAALQRDTRQLHLVRRGGLLSAFPLGVAFGAGWTPCIGPTLAAVLTLSAAGDGATARRGALLAFAYALGLGLPFVAVGLALERSRTALDVLRRRGPALRRAGGVLLVVVGLLLVTGVWDRVLVAIQPALTGWTPAL